MPITNEKSKTMKEEKEKVDYTQVIIGIISVGLFIWGIKTMLF